MKSNKSFSRIIFFDQIPYFCNCKNGQKSNFELGKLPKMQFHEEKIDLFNFTSFFAWTFLNFLADDDMSLFLSEQTE